MYLPSTEASGPVDSLEKSLLRMEVTEPTQCKLPATLPKFVFMLVEELADNVRGLA